MTDFSEYPHNLVTNVKGEATVRGNGRVTWRVDSDGILHVTHLPSYGESTTAIYGLVHARKSWVAVDEP